MSPTITFVDGCFPDYRRFVPYIGWRHIKCLFKGDIEGRFGGETSLSGDLEKRLRAATIQHLTDQLDAVFVDICIERLVGDQIYSSGYISDLEAR